jgi:peptide/nickel transport system substrate-binding protein
MINRRTALALLASAAVPGQVFAQSSESEFLQDQVDAGTLPKVANRLPKNPRVINLAGMGRKPGVQGGKVRTLIGGQRDVRYMPMFGYARLVGFDQDLQLQPDILEHYTIDEGRIFTFHLRDGHKWSDGSDFTARDFAYNWDDVINNDKLMRGGPPVDLKVNDQVAKFEMLDRLTVRFSWDIPAPHFLPRLADPSPLTLMLPSEYMKQFHANYQSEEKLAELCAIHRVDDWKRLHTKMSRQNRPENPELPTLEPWMPRTQAPSEQFLFDRNPFFHRVDENGTQLPYLDRFELNVSSSEIITAKTATGESDLQFTGLSFSDYTLLKEAETRYPIKVSLWTSTKGSSVTLRPNLNFNDDVWRNLFQDVRVRRALSLAINRKEINKVIFYGLGNESADTVLPASPLYKPEYSAAWSSYDPKQANALLDEAGMDKRDIYGRRLLPDGRQAHIIIESSGESTLETDVLELITDHYREVGLSLFIRVSQRDIFRSRALGGNVMMSVWAGLDNGVPTADMPPTGLAPTADDDLQWPIWGAYYSSAETTGQPPDLPGAMQLIELLKAWKQTTSVEDRTRIWGEMLALRADQVFTIGTVSGALQPIVKSSQLRNVPTEGLYGFKPTSYLGVYLPDTFWYDKEA